MAERNLEVIKMNEVEMQPDPVDYGEWKSGVNTAGTLSAVNETGEICWTCK